MHVFLGYPFVFDAQIGYREKLRAMCSRGENKLTTADDRYQMEHILDAVLEGIKSADCCVFDITGSNPNVMFEVGYAYALKIDMILLQGKVKSTGLLSGAKFEDPPSDLKSIRILKYSDLTDLEGNLLAALKSVEASKHQEDQFDILLERFLSTGAKSTKTISAHMEEKLGFSYQMTRNRLEQRVEERDLGRDYRGKEAVYGPYRR